MSVVREAAVAGLFYPDLQSVLSKSVDELLLRARSHSLTGRLRGLIAPHAGYMYSGYTAAVGYKLLKGTSFDSIVIVGPSHREYFDGISVYSGDYFRTPLGEVAVDTELREDLVRDNPGIVSSDTGHRSEHSIEVQLPFLQRSFGKFRFVPIIMGDQRRHHCEELGNAIGRACKGKNVLLVASSDLSHYHSYHDAVRLDRQVVEEVEKFNIDGLMKKLSNEEVEACGGGPVVAVMRAAQELGANRSRILYYCNSGDVTGEKDAVVGYLSAALFQEN